MYEPVQWSRVLAGLRGFMRALCASVPGARTVEVGGVAASVVPSAPDRSVVNCVTYGDAAELERALPQIAEEYEAAGVRAWTVWVPHGEPAATGVLERAGHVLDGRPEAMGLELSDLRPADAQVELLSGATLELVGRLNDVAYGTRGDFERGLRGGSSDPFQILVAGLDGQPAGCVLSCDVEGDCGVYLVATVPRLRGRGIAAALMTRALLAARERGCVTSTLQATALGRPVYERLGYRDVGPLEMWERRRVA
jgi:GNAT superfamily N-acetyltransferase